MNFDGRARFSGEDKVDAAGTVLTSYVSAMAYNVAGQVTGMTSGSGVAESYTYSNDRLQLTRQTATKGATTLMDLNYSYGAVAGASGAATTAGNSGQLISTSGTINGQNRGQSFSYDDLGRLVSASSWGASQRSYSYDRWGNRTAMSDSVTGATQTLSLQLSGGVPTNRITSVTNGGLTSAQTYDAAGNLIGDGAHSYQYDGEGRIATVDANGATYSYDSTNRRVKKVVGSTVIYYVWQGAQVIAEYSNAPAGAGGTSYYLADRLSTRMTTDTNGVFKGSQDHLPFGEDPSTSTGQIEKHRFTTYERDTESGTDYAINRQHQYANGRFTQPDPIDGNTDFPQTLNGYSYSANDPINLWDPLGLEFGAQSQGVCPAEFKTCVDVIIPGIGRVMVGLDGLGGGTFIWGNSNLTDQQLSRFNELFGGLPKTFLINPSLQQMLDTEESPFVKGVRNDIYKSFLAEVEDCKRAGREALSGSQASLDKLGRALGNRAVGKVRTELLKYAGRKAIEKGMVSTTTLAGKLFRRWSYAGLVTPAGVALFYLQMSYDMAPTNEEMEAQMEYSRISAKIDRECRKAVRKKYGL